MINWNLERKSQVKEEIENKGVKKDGKADYCVRRRRNEEKLWINIEDMELNS